MSQRFRLGVVLRLREIAEDEAQVRLAQALEVHRHALEDLHRLMDGAEAERSRFSALQHGEVAAAGVLIDAADSVAGAERSVGQGRDRLEKAAGGLLEARRALADASRRREIVERLRDRFIAARRREEDRREAATLSDMAVTRHAWRVLGEGQQ